MVLTAKEESLIRLGISLYKKRLLLTASRLAKSSYNVSEIDTLQNDIKAEEYKIKEELA